MSHLNPTYSPLHYVLLFPHGDQGWDKDIPTTPGSKTKKVSQRCYYAYCLFPRPNQSKAIFYTGRLFQQYVVDAWASIEESELHWIRTHQKDIRAELYQGLRDVVEDSFGSDNIVDLAQQGTRIILPSSHMSSPRHMFQLLQDSLAISRWAQNRPDLFVTVTANPNWPEILEALLEFQGVTDDPNEPTTRQTAADRPDIVARVFKKKLDAILKELIKDGILGKAIAHVYTIEFQKRGLPHCHILIFLDHNDRPHDAAAINSIISAQIPDPEADPLLYQTVTTCMMHGPCGPEHPRSPCLDNNKKCTKQFPKAFCEQTSFVEDGYPHYARPNNGRTYTNSKGFVFDNRWVVPYNPYLSAKYNCHINVEICGSIKACKYIHKYIYKGHDLATVQVWVDEIKEYIDSCYIGPIEACWRIMEFPMHQEKPSVYRLPVHEENKHTIFFRQDDIPEEILANPAINKTQLTEWFMANQQYPDASNYIYSDFPQKFVWNPKQKKWTVRKQDFAIGRMSYVHPTAGERFYLRLLLTIVKGAKSWKDLRIYNGVEYPTYKATCLAYGLLKDDGEWDQCLQEAGDMKTGNQLRRLFAIILLHCYPTSPEVLWENHKHRICDDLEHKLGTIGYQEPSEEQIYDYGLHLLNQILMQSLKSLEKFPNMPLPQHEWDIIVDNPILHDQLSYDLEELAVQVEERKQSFNQEQMVVFNAVMDSVKNEQGKLFFVHSAGGCGKTYLCNTIAAAVRSLGKVALCVASSGIASLLLDGGRTAHSRFKIPIPVHEDSSCGIKKGSNEHGVLMKTGIKIWDEVPMQHKLAAEAVDRSDRDLLDKDVPFGGITVLFGGDFRQTLPVVPHGSREQIVRASLCKSQLWRHINLYHLTQNMRLDNTPDSDQFAKWLLDIGGGKNIDASGQVELLPNMVLPENDVDHLVDFVYAGLIDQDLPHDYFLHRTILSPTNDAVDDLNYTILSKFPGEMTVLHSRDQVIDTPDAPVDYPIEFLNSIKVSGLPLSHLSLKPGCPLMLLRNIDPLQGLCNGTRMVLMEIKQRVLQCRILGGSFAGNIVFIPRITIDPSSEEMPIPMSRHQFPVRLAFVMTINKAQGQSVRIVGLDLHTPVFSHGQLYVALSRCTSRDRIKVLMEGTKTANIVYPEVLQGII